MSLKGIAKETLSILDANGFATSNGDWVSLAAEQKAAVENTQLYTPQQGLMLLDSGSGIGSKPKYIVSNETTQAAACRLVSREKISDLVVLNFASARNAGGGFINGAKAQEEDLARCSGLYPCLLTQPSYYAENRHQQSLLYTDHIIYSPKVPWFRIRSRTRLDYIFLASVITAPAPNAGQALSKQTASKAEIEECLRRRSGIVLSIARDNGHRNLVLGAWGCGVFANDPVMVADAFASWLESKKFAGAFDQVSLAVLDRSKGGDTYSAFEQRYT